MSNYPMRLCRDGKLRPIPPRATNAQRIAIFNSLLVPFGKDCLVFKKPLNGSAGWRGEFNYDGKTWIPCHLAFVLAKGPIPKGKRVCHACDEGRCCNPNHLFAGTQLENMRDMISKGRAFHPAGEQHERARLTVGEIKEIRRRMAVRKWGDAAKIAREFGISAPQVFNIAARRIWSCVL